MNRYDKTEWIANKTLVTANNLNKIERQIETLTNKSIELNSKYENIDNNIHAFIDDTSISTKKIWSSAKIEDFIHTNDGVVWNTVRGEHLSVDHTKEGKLREIEIWGNTIQDQDDLSNIQHLGELYVNKEGQPILDNKGKEQYKIEIHAKETLNLLPTKCELMGQPTVKVKLKAGVTYTIFSHTNTRFVLRYFGSSNIAHINNMGYWSQIDLPHDSTGKVFTFTVQESWLKNADYFYIINTWLNGYLSKEELFLKAKARMFEGTVDLYSNVQDHKSFTYDELYVNTKSHKTTILLPCQLMKVGNTADRLYWDNEKQKYIVEKNTLKFLANYVTRGVGESNGYVWLYRLNDIGAKDSKIITDSNVYIGFRDSDWVILKVNSDFYRGNGYELTNDDASRFLKDYPVNIICATSNSTLVETDIVKEIEAPCYKDRTHLFVEGGIDGDIKAKTPVNGGKAIQSLSIENEEIKAINNLQNELINTTMMAADEMYMMLEPLLSELLINESNSSKMVDMYVAMVQRELKSIEQVPERYKEQVRIILNQLDK